jgi:hypothetical protein
LGLSPVDFWNLTFQEFSHLADYHKSKLEYEQYCVGLTPSILYNIHKSKTAKAMKPLDFFKSDNTEQVLKIRDTETLKKVFVPLFQKT